MSLHDPETGEIVEPATPFVPPTIGDAPAHVPGIYFGLDFETYLAIPALSSHGVRQIAADPALFWERSWLNPERVELDAKHLLFGKAAHCRILEGKEAFEARHAAAIDKADFPDLIATVADLTEALALHGVEAKGGKAELTAALLEVWPDAPIWETLQRAHAEEVGDRALLPRDFIRRIERAAGALDANPALAPALTGGWPEVTLLWHCPETGVPMKARADYIKTRAIVDLKTFANQQERSLQRAISHAIAAYKYTIQPSVYLEGARIVRELVRAGDAAIGLELASGPDHIAAARRWVEQWAAHEAPDDWLWLFQSKGAAPVTMGVWYPVHGVNRLFSDNIVREAKRTFRACCERFGAAPWIESHALWDMADEDMPPWTVEI